MASLVLAVAFIGAILGGLLGITSFRLPVDQVGNPLYEAVPYVSWLSLVIGVVGLLLLALRPFRRFVARGLFAIGNRLDPAATPTVRRRLTELQDHVDTLAAWLYRRKYWRADISDEAKFSEGAPESHGQTLYDALGIKRKYKRPPRAIAEPGYNGPESDPMGRTGNARAALAGLVESANQLHDQLTEGGSDDELNALIEPWYVRAQEIVAQHTDQLGPFQATKSYVRQIRRGMSEHQVYCLQWLEDHTERLIEIQRALK